MRTRTLIATVAGLAAVAATASPASAITYGEPDAGEHPYVGLMVAYTWNDVNADKVMTDDELFAAWRCTGTQMDADTFLTAGHCTYGADAVAIWYGDDLRAVRSARGFVTFDEAIDQDTPLLDADAWSYDAISHPKYDDSAFYLHDVGVVDDMILAPGTSFSAYGELPEEGYWDEQIATRRTDRDSYTTVGYGLQVSTPSQGLGRTTQDDWLKLKAGGDLIGYRVFGGGRTNDAYVVLTNNAHTGGTCSGDSGGPTFIEGTRTVVAVTSFGVNSNCAGTSGVYRIDTADDLLWLSQYID